MLWSLIRIAFRNVTRNTKRSLITMAAIIIGCACIVFARGFMNGLHKGMIDGITQTITGDVQIHHKDYLKATDALPLNLSVRMDDALLDVLKAEPRIDAWSGRLRFTGMLSNGLSTTLFIGNAIDPEHEYKVTPDLEADVIAPGRSISNDEAEGVVIADRLAKAMKLSVGDSLTLTASTKDGALNTLDVTVLGIRKATGAFSGTEGKMVDMPLKTAQQLLYMEGEVTEVVLNVPDHEKIEEVAIALQQRIEQQAPQLNLAVNDWRTVSAFFVNILSMQDVVLWIVIIVLFAVMISGIVNTMLMAVFERIREIGTMMAMGVRRKKVVTLFICEGIALGVIGAIGGVIIGYIVVQLFHMQGVEFHPAAYNKPVFVRPFVHLTYLGLVVFIAIISALLAAIYPAYRAAQLEPAEALRTL